MEETPRHGMLIRWHLQQWVAMGNRCRKRTFTNQIICKTLGKRHIGLFMIYKMTSDRILYPFYLKNLNNLYEPYTIYVWSLKCLSFAIAGNQLPERHDILKLRYCIRQLWKRSSLNYEVLSFPSWVLALKAVDFVTR